MDEFSQSEKVLIAGYASVELLCGSDHLDIGRTAVAFTESEKGGIKVYVEDVGKFTVNKSMEVAQCDNGTYAFSAASAEWYHERDYYDPIKHSICVTMQFIADENSEADLGYINFLFHTYSTVNGKPPAIEGVNADGEMPASVQKHTWLLKGAQMICTGIEKVGEMTSIGIDKASKMYQENTEGEQKQFVKPPTEAELKKYQKIEKIAEKVKDGTGAVSSFIDEQVFKIAKKATDKSGEKLSESKPESAVKKTAGFGGAALYGASMVISCIEQTGMKVLTKAATESSECMAHKYGMSSGLKADCVSNATLDAARAALNIKRCGVRGIMKGLVKDAGGNIIYVANDKELPRTTDPNKAYKNR